MSRLLSQTVVYAVLCLLLAPGDLLGATAIRLSHGSQSSRLVINQLQRELKRIAKPSGHSFAWVEDARALPGRRVSVRLLGNCTSELEVAATDGALGWTKIVDGRILPYIEVDCNRVRATILPDIERQEPVFREAALGRALARVLAHELRHALARTLTHEDHGLARVSLASRDLLYGSYKLDAADLEPLAELERHRRPAVETGPVAADAVGAPADAAAEFPIDVGR